MAGNQDLVQRIRAKVVGLAQIDTNLFHPKDVERVRDNDWTVERFVLVSATEDQAFRALFDALKWRKSFGVNDFDDHYFPEEFYKIGLFSTHAVDKEGRPVVWVKVRPRTYEHDAALSPLVPLFRQFMVYNFERVDRQCTDQGWALVVDMSDAGVSTTDRKNTEFGIEVITKYYPRAIKFAAVVDQPWVLRTVLKLIISFLNEELKSIAKFISREELVEYVSQKFIPIQLNGLYDKDLVVVPKGAKRFSELGHKWFPNQRMDKIIAAMNALDK